MTSRDHGRPGRRRTPREWRTPEQLALAFEQALLWRALWRARALLPDDEPEEEAGLATAANSQAENAARRARFATAIARAEFGRFYRKDHGQAGVSKKGNGVGKRRKPD